MNFTDFCNQETEKKYLDMLDGKTQLPIQMPKLTSFSKFEKNYKQYHQRLKDEEKAINSEIRKIENYKAKRDEEEKRRREKEERQRQREYYDKINRRNKLKKRIIIISVSIIVIVGIVLGIIFGVKSCNEDKLAHSSDNIEIEVTGKTESLSYNSYVTTFSFKLTNNSIYTVTQIVGEIVFYDGDADFGSGTLTFNYELAPSSYKSATTKYSGSSDVYKNLYEIAYTDLKVTYQITSITFEDDDTRTYDDSEVKIIKALG